MAIISHNVRSDQQCTTGRTVRATLNRTVQQQRSPRPECTELYGTVRYVLTRYNPRSDVRQGTAVGGPRQLHVVTPLQIGINGAK